MLIRSVVLILCCLCGVAASADTITGTVRNQTTGQPAAGDDVFLLRLDGMQDQARTKTDPQGVFTFNDTDAKTVYVVRVLHKKVNYDQNVTGVNPLEIRVFDVVPKIAGLSGKIGMAQIEPDNKTLKVTEMYSITNVSTPPVAQAGGSDLEISIPAAAVLDWLQVRDQAGNWSNRSALPVHGHSGTYVANVPFLPGDTIYKFSYHLPYRGPTAFHLKVAYPIRNFAVSLPPSVSLKPSQPGAFKVGAANGLQLYATSQPVTKDVPVFVVSTTGATLPPPQRSNAMPPPEAVVPPSAPAAASRPHAIPAEQAQAPEQANAQSKQEFWPILTLIILVLAAGLFGLWRMRRNMARPATHGPGSKGQLSLLDALKEELFRLENDRLQGTISAEEYESAKAALNQNIQRAMK